MYFWLTCLTLRTRRPTTLHVLYLLQPQTGPAGKEAGLVQSILRQLSGARGATLRNRFELDGTMV
jgi:hypothetical protein